MTRLAAVPEASDARTIEVTPCPNGPLLVRGADRVRDADGTAHPVTRPVVAVCTCLKSQRQPWCDGTHKVIPRNRSAPAQEAEATSSPSRIPPA